MTIGVWDGLRRLWRRIKWRMVTSG